MDKIRIIICDDIAEIREHIQSIINKQDDMITVGTASNGNEAVKVVERLKPDIVLMDIQMENERAGILATERIKNCYPHIKVVVLTVLNDNDLIFDAYVAGAIDYIIKSSDGNTILQQIRACYQNENFIGPVIAKALKKEVRDMKRKQNSLLFFIKSFSMLTPAERNITKLLYKGYSRSMIVQENYMELSTLKTHIRHILRKTDYKSTKELVKFLHEVRLFEVFDL